MNRKRCSQSKHSPRKPAWLNKQSVENTKKENKTREEKACRTIQLWWRRMKIRNTAGKAAVRRMMESKRNEMQIKLTTDKKLEYEKHLEDFEELRNKETKARELRQRIISDIHDRKPAANIHIRKSTLNTSSRRNGQMKSKSRGKETLKSNDSSKGSSISPKTTPNQDMKTVDGIYKSSCYSERSPRELIESSISNDDITDDNSTLVSESCSTKSKTTFADLMETLRDLEDDVPDDLITKSNNLSQKANVNAETSKETIGSLLSADKLNSIMSFLDEVEKEDIKVVEEAKRSYSTTSKSELESSFIPSKAINNRPSDTFNSANQVASDITNAIEQQKIEMDEKQKTVDMMKKAISQQKEFTSMQIIEMDKEQKQQLSIQRNEYEATIQRHLSFIDQLIDDKKVLTQRCEELVSKLKDIDHKYTTKIKHMTESHSVELKKQKEIGEAAEKLRREKWIKEKTQEIKEITVKGLEPDIQKLIAKHKAEIKKIKAMKQGEVLQADERVGRRYIEQFEDLRAQLTKEKEVALKKEREMAKQRYENQIREEEASFQQLRHRLYQEVEDEKERLSKQTQHLNNEFEEKKSAYEASFKQNYSSMEEDRLKKLQQCQQQHVLEMNKLKEQLEIEKQQWIENYMKKQESELLAKERQLREGVREARDQEIEMIIARFEQENTINREESERAAENRIKRIRNKYENEIKELEHSERNTYEKCTALKSQVEQMENECIGLKSENKCKEQELSDVQNLLESLQNERGKVTNIVRQEFADRLVALEEESKRLRTELSEEKARHKFNIDRLTKDKDDEMEEVHKRVKKAMSKKEETARVLREQIVTAEKRAEHLEQILSEQRKKILGK